MKPAENEPIVYIQSEGSEPPLCFVSHEPLALTGHRYRMLSTHLGSAQPCYILQWQGADERSVPLSVDAIVSTQLEDLRRAQPHGPYRLFGVCFAGIVALELARQLEAQGETVEFVLIVDAGAAHKDVWLAWRVSRLVGAIFRLSPERKLEWFDRLRGRVDQGGFFFRLRHPPSLKPAEHAKRVFRATHRILRRPRGGSRTSPDSAASRSPSVQHLYDSRRLFLMAGYTALPINGTVGLVFAEQTVKDLDVVTVWRNVREDAVLRILPGYHAGIMDEGLGLVAEVLASSIEEAQPTRRRFAASR
jgi:thioesterase domain-containing protein